MSVSYSATLTRVLERAKQYCGSASTEGMIAAAIELYLQQSENDRLFSSDENIQVISEITADMCDMLRFIEQHGCDIASLGKALASKAAQKDVYDGINFQKLLIIAKQTAERDNLPQITVDMLFKTARDDSPETVESLMTSRCETADEAAFSEIHRPSTVPDASACYGAPAVGSQRQAGGYGAAAANRGGDEPLYSNLTDTTSQAASAQCETVFTSADAPRVDVNVQNGLERISSLIERVGIIQDKLFDAIYGQDNAVSIFCSGYFRAEMLNMTDKKRYRPKATFLFAGPPGVGKTFLAETAAGILGVPYMRFDMSEYSDKEANMQFAGSDSIYKDSKSGNVTSFVQQNPECVLLFDEIEKAHINVIHLFLQILDAGRLRDSHTDTEVSFKDAVIIFTTNAGKQLYQDNESGDFSSLSRKVILASLASDKKPESEEPLFPAAICSRFASGNVVMFNSMDAHNLRTIAKKEVMRHADNFKNSFGVNIDIDENVFTSLLFAEGGNADARTIRSRAETFINNELYELFRLISTGKAGTDAKKITSIHIGVEVPESGEISLLYGSPSKPRILAFASHDIVGRCNEYAPDFEFVGSESVESAKEILQNSDITFAVIDMTHGISSGRHDLLNIEDVDSKARDFFKFAKEYYPELPLYIIDADGSAINAAERVSFMRAGVRDIIALADREAFADVIAMICERDYQQKSMRDLARSNKVINYETEQFVSGYGTRAEIMLFDLKLSTAVDAEDSKSILNNISRPDVRFKDVIGAENAKDELKYFVEYLRNPKKYKATGVRPPRGVLLYGPPGTGKTMLAKAMACESGATFIASEGNQFIRKYHGEGVELVHELFRRARRYAPSILFIDEIDAIAKERSGSDSNVSIEAALTAFLTEMDGFNNDSSRPVFVLAATNFDVEPGSARSLDAALMRRFDRKVLIDLPDKNERMQYLNARISANGMFSIGRNTIDSIATRSAGMSPAELESILEMALRSAIRTQSPDVNDELFEEAFESFNSGETKKWDISQLERVARHEAGHAFICWKNGETPAYLTIVARGDHGGYMQHADNEGKAIYTRDELLCRIQTSLGGRASEIVYYGEDGGISTGASGDLANATRIAARMLCTYGMYASFGMSTVDLPATGAIADEIRTGINALLDAQLKETVRIISENTAAIDRMVEVLMVKNHLSAGEIDAVFNGAGLADLT